MVTPIQTRTGSSTLDNDYLNELRNFYNKPENEGKASEFVAQNGEKFHIEDSSYLSKVTSNFLSGKFDRNINKSINDGRKSKSERSRILSDKADTSLDNNKDSKTTSTDTTAAEAQNALASTPADAAGAATAVSAGKAAEAQAQADQVGNGVEDGIDTSFSKVGRSSAPVLAKDAVANQAGLAKNQAYTQKSTEEQATEQQTSVETKQNLNEKKIVANTSVEQVFVKLKEDKKLNDKSKKEIKAKAKGNNTKDNKADAAKKIAVEAQAQSGAKMGFDGALATNSGSLATNSGSTKKDDSTKDAASTNVVDSNSGISPALAKKINQNWQTTMSGPKAITADTTLRVKVEADRQPELKSATEAAEAASAAGHQEAAALRQASQQNLGNSTNQTQNAKQNYDKSGQSGTKAVAEAVVGAASCYMGYADITAGLATTPVGTGLVAKGVLEVATGLSSFASAATNGKESKNKSKEGQGLRQDSSKGRQASEEALNKAAERDAAAAAAGQAAIDKINAENAKSIEETNQYNANKNLAAANANVILKAKSQAIQDILAEKAKDNSTKDKKTNKQNKTMLPHMAYSALSSIQVNDSKEEEALKVKRERQIMTHEEAHSAIIGGTPVVITDGSGMPIGGYVAIDIPTVNNNDLEGTMRKAQRVINAALAPADPSAQDMNVASQANSVLNQAQSLLEKKAEEKKKAEKEETNKTEEKEETDKSKEAKKDIKNQK